jgi:hypothetical protein
MRKNEELEFTIKATPVSEEQYNLKVSVMGRHSDLVGAFLSAIEDNEKILDLLIEVTATAMIKDVAGMEKKPRKKPRKKPFLSQGGEA